MKHILIALLSLVIFDSGCGVASKSTDTTKTEFDVRVVYSDALIINCQKIAPVSAWSGFGGLALQTPAKYSVRRKMKNKTEALGGNVLRENNISSGFMGAKGDGIAYKCQPEWFNKIPSAEKEL